MKPCFAGLGAIMLASTPLAAIPLAISGTTAQAHDDIIVMPKHPTPEMLSSADRPARA